MKSYQMSGSIKSSILFSVQYLSQWPEQYNLKNTRVSFFSLFFAHFAGNNSFTIRNMCMTQHNRKKKETMTAQQQKQLKIKTKLIPFVNIYLIKVWDNLKIMNTVVQVHYIDLEKNSKLFSLYLSLLVYIT